MNCHILIAVLFTQVNNLKVCQSRNLPETARNDFLNFSVIQDPLVRQYSKEYNTLCPHTHMCNVKINYNASLFGFSDDLKRILKPCCEYCTCGSECLRTLDCCLDDLPRLLSSEEVIRFIQTLNVAFTLSLDHSMLKSIIVWHIN